jgi:hypothetical protein
MKSLGWLDFSRNCNQEYLYCTAKRVVSRETIIRAFKTNINPVKPSGNYMSHLLFICGFHMIITVNSDYFLKQR